MSTFVIDIDGTLCGPPVNADYSLCNPYHDVIACVNKMHKEGHKIILFTSRGMRSCSGNLNLIHEKVKPVLIEWLNNHGVQYDELIFGKPWGDDVVYVDDKAIRPNEFLERVKTL